jgi:uncharacterized protein (DUF433 family)
MDDLPSLITVDPARRGGRPCVRDLRISVGDVLGWLAQGLSTEEVLAEYPELTSDDIRACVTLLTEPARRIRCGVLQGRLTITDDFDAPLPPEVLAAFEGR